MRIRAKSRVVGRGLQALYGHTWTIATHMDDISPEESAERRLSSAAVKCVASSIVRKSPATYSTQNDAQTSNDIIVCGPTTLSSSNRRTSAQLIRGRSSQKNSGAHRLACIGETAHHMRTTSHFAIFRLAATIRICAHAINAIHVMLKT
jgi:hypothetical protein